MGAEFPLHSASVLNTNMTGEDEFRVCHCSQETAKLGTVFSSCSAWQLWVFLPQLLTLSTKPLSETLEEEKDVNSGEQSTVDLQSKRKMSLG